MYNHCQNPKCHHNPTTDRVRGTKGNKVYVTRSSTDYFGIACTYHCLYEYMRTHAEAMGEFDKMQKALSKFMRLNPKAYMTLLD